MQTPNRTVDWCITGRKLNDQEQNTPLDPNPHQDDDLPNDEELTAITMDRVLEILARGRFDEEHGAIRWSSNYTFLTSLTHQDTTVMAVYKPQRGERPLWDFPDGTLCYRERASFLTSQELDWQLVPPTVLRKGPRGLGSVQFFVEHDPDHHYFSFDEGMLPQLSRLALFDYLVNNADRKGGHCLVDATGHLWGIDHGITFHSAHKLRTVIWNFAGHPIPENYLEEVSVLCEKLEAPDSAFRCELNQLLSEGEIRSFGSRIRRILKTKEYPSPGPGPNYPWPPV